MSLRTTQSYITTLDRGDGTLRVSQAYVTVLTRDVEIQLSVSNAFGFSAGQSTVVPTFAATSNDFNFQQIATHNIVVVECSNSLGLAAATGFDYEEDIIQYFGWTPRTILPVGNSLWFDGGGEFSPQRLSRVVEADAENNFGLSVAILQAHNATNSFGFAATVNGVQEFTITNSLGLQPAIDSADTEYGRDMEQGLLKQHLSYKITGNNCTEKDFAPFVGSGGDPSYEAINTTPPTLEAGTLTLTYPFVSPTSMVVLRNPSFGNTDVISRSAVHQKTRGGEDLVAADPAWPTVEVLTFTVENLCEENITELVAFLNDSLGQLVGLLDWESRQWSGVILTPDTEIVQVSRSVWRFTLVFRGELA